MSTERDSHSHSRSRSPSTSSHSASASAASNGSSATDTDSDDPESQSASAPLIGSHQRHSAAPDRLKSSPYGAAPSTPTASRLSYCSSLLSSRFCDFFFSILIVLLLLGIALCSTLIFQYAVLYQTPGTASHSAALYSSAANSAAGSIQPGSANPASATSSSYSLGSLVSRLSDAAQGWRAADSVPGNSDDLFNNKPATPVPTVFQKPPPTDPNTKPSAESEQSSEDQEEESQAAQAGQTPTQENNQDTEDEEEEDEGNQGQNPEQGGNDKDDEVEDEPDESQPSPAPSPSPVPFPAMPLPKIPVSRYSHLALRQLQTLQHIGITSEFPSITNPPIQGDPAHPLPSYRFIHLFHRALSDISLKIKKLGANNWHNRKYINQTMILLEIGFGTIDFSVEFMKSFAHFSTECEQNSRSIGNPQLAFCYRQLNLYCFETSTAIMEEAQRRVVSDSFRQQLSQWYKSPTASKFAPPIPKLKAFRRAFSSSPADEWDGAGASSDGPVAVESVDSWFKKEKLKTIHVVKSSTDQMEPEILRGASKSFEKKRILAWLFQYSPHQWEKHKDYRSDSHSFTSLLKFFDEFGYDVYFIGRSNLYMVKEETWLSPLSTALGSSTPGVAPNGYIPAVAVLREAKYGNFMQRVVNWYNREIVVALYQLVKQRSAQAASGDDAEN